MAPEIALDHIATAEPGGVQRVLDPMCGSGTVLVAAVERGHDAIGFDMDPLAVLMAGVATSEIDLEVFKDAGATAALEARRSRAFKPPWSDPETELFARYWFGDPQRLQLIRLMNAIDKVAPGPVRSALKVAVSRTIVTKSPRASLAADTAHSRPHKVIEASDYDVIDGFQESAHSLHRLLGRRIAAGGATARLGDARIMDDVPDATIDTIVTSPPYLNAIDYLRGHRLALIWLGHSIAELRGIRSRSIGAERAPTDDPHELAHSIVDLLKRGAVNPNALPHRVILRYANDMCLLAEEAHRVLKPGAPMVSVVGNSTIRGNYIPNAQILKEVLLYKGFSITEERERVLPDSRRYMPIGPKTGSHGLANRMRTEVVLVASRDAS